MYKENTLPRVEKTASGDLLVLFMADIKTSRLLLDVSALWGGVAPFRSVKVCLLVLMFLQNRAVALKDVRPASWPQRSF